MVRFLSLLLILKASTLTDASVSIAESKCTDFTFPDDNVVRELCFSVMMLSPPPTQVGLPNGTEYTEYSGEASETYSFENDLEGLTTAVTWEYEGNFEDCVATANGEDCLSCTLCDNKSVSADCTNLEHGRNVECGDTSLISFGYINETDFLKVKPFFPFSSSFEYKAGSDTTLPAAGGTPSGSASACHQMGWLAIVGTLVMLTL